MNEVNIELIYHNFTTYLSVNTSTWQVDPEKVDQILQYDLDLQ